MALILKLIVDFNGDYNNVSDSDCDCDNEFDL